MMKVIIEGDSLAQVRDGCMAVAHAIKPPPPSTSGKGRNPDGRKMTKDGLGGYGGGFGWDDSPMRRGNSKSPGRKMASAMIAKIPLPLSRHIAATFAR